MNANCPNCGTLHVNLNYGTIYSCSVCKNTFHLVVQPNQIPSQPTQSSGGGIGGFISLIALGISLYVVYLCFTQL